MVDRAALTEERIRTMDPPAEGEAVLWDSKLTGFGVRCFPSGRKVYILMYRPKVGAKRPKRRMTLGEVGAVRLADARAAAQAYLGQIAKGADPQQERKQVAKREAARLDRAIDAYAAYLDRREVVNAAQIVRTLRRYMPGPLDKIELPALDRQAVAARILKIETATVGETVARKPGDKRKGEAKVRRKFGGIGAAADFRAKANAFFNWAVGQGLLYANPLAGWRRERQTRAQLTSRTGRALSDNEIKAVWEACDRVKAPYGDFVRLLLLTGQRRTETSRVRWPDIDFSARLWTIPATEAKNGRQHAVPLPAAAAGLFSSQERRATSKFVFAGRTEGSVISNWSRRQADLVRASGVHFTLHDLRRTFRSGLRRVGADSELAEMMLNHTRAGLIETYDREPRMQERAVAAAAWARHVLLVVDGGGDHKNESGPIGTNVVQLRA